MPDALIAVCSYNPRPSVQNDHSKGSQGWRRDVYHLTDNTSTTLCGISTYGWSVIGPKPTDELDHHCCVRCKGKTDALLKALEGK